MDQKHPNESEGQNHYKRESWKIHKVYYECYHPFNLTLTYFTGKLNILLEFQAFTSKEGYES